MIVSKILGFLAWALYRLISITWKIQVIEPESLKERLKSHAPCIFSHWHGDELALLPLVRRYRVGALVSQSKDGEIMNTFLKLLGAWTIRGSSSRGGSRALLSLIRHIKNTGANCSFAVDGPRGPRHQVKPGIFQLQKKLHPAQVPIFAAGVAVNSYWQFDRSWNKAILPKPFAHIVIHWTESAIKLTETDDSHNQTFVSILTNEMHTSQKEAEKSLKFLSN
ncbi:MAG: DUF374 domain-containing protein [Pseudobdellovibrionaceae bacterium]|nr:DUF374 domain-containing protein [Pseudobdellovibrionaceae bacterium]